MDKLEEEIKALMLQAKTISEEEKNKILQKLPVLTSRQKLALRLNLLKTLFLEAQKDTLQQWQKEKKEIKMEADLEEFSGQVLNQVTAKEDAALSQAQTSLLSQQIKNV